MSAGSVKAPLIIPLRPPSKSYSSNAVDSATQIEISTNTPRAQIYFTVDGSRPDPKSWKSRKPQLGPTYHYRSSFTLQSGSRTIKAMALLPDTGQESNVVAKTFDVIEAPKVNMNGEVDSQINPDDYLFVEKQKREMKKVQVSAKDSLMVRRKPFASGKKLTLSLGNENENHKPPTEENPLLSKSKIVTQELSKLNKKTRSSGKRNEMTLQLRTDGIFNCPTCLAPRPEDPESAFCTSCGRSLPPPLSRSVDADPEFCSICGSKIPVDSTKCLVCESPVAESPDNTNRRICPICGCLNPARVRYCLTCESDLPQTPTTFVNISSLLDSSTPLPTENSKHSSVADCRICSRENALSARFCEWCGIQDPGEELTKRRNCICPSCFWQLPKDSKFCPQCGFELVAIEERNCFGDQLKVAPAKFFRKTTSTQTVGPSPYSPPSRNKLTESSKARLPMIAPISPGKGLWRMQIEHLVAHIKAYARTNSEFQKAISEPRMGKLISAEVIGNRPEEVSILLVFHQHNSSIQPPTRNGNDGAGDELEVFVEAPRFARSNYSSQPQSSDYNNIPLRNLFSASTPVEQKNRTFRRKIVALRSPSLASKLTKKPSQDHPNRPSEVDSVLMRELRPGHKVDMYTVERLLMNGANPSCVDHYGEAIPILVKSDADANAISVRDGNTPLHEAVLLGALEEKNLLNCS
ncbi:unnamed protein product [Hymenolepis diminuta]|uniref:GH29D-like beta-sandwich domain-containing protein n=1 Tax=Hymenolepis diminuta TaxID=6216 RepID=A0A564YV57_HYMDI|nr:unnamed protein product [Hymenolepis diminuta]